MKCGVIVPKKLTSCVTVIFLVCLETVLLSTVSNCAKTFYVHWNTTNSIFRIDNTDHIIDVNKGNLKFGFDQVNIICPLYSPGQFDEYAEKYIIYNVSKEEYDTCRITNPNPRIIAICDKPHELKYFTITFRPFTPLPGGLEFLAGNDYYFISTSSKDDLHRRIGGRCSSHNMKMVFKVCCSTTSATPISTASPNGVVPFRTIQDMHVVTRVWSSVGQTTLQPSKATQSVVPPVPPVKKGTLLEPQKHPNEVVKNEELTYNDAAASDATKPLHCWFSLGFFVLLIRLRRNASGSTTPTSTLRKGETTPGGSQRNVSIFETTTTTRSSSQTASSGTTNGRRRPIPMDQRAPFR
uniref:Putative ephrin ligand for eph receptor tyrosine kinase n=1 Tax=Xenopsylla cheopis TaxID=163159 RepID=A0A6M2DZU3_XENCH